MSAPDRPPAIFIGDNLGLDFLNSIAIPVAVVVDWILDGEGFLDWAAQANLASPDVISTLRARATPGELDAAAARARHLREWFRGFVQSHMGRPLEADALQQLEFLNVLMERDEAFLQLAPRIEGQHRFELRVVHRWRSADDLLIPVAEALASMVCTEDFTHIKHCEGRICTLMFADHTRGHGRRWCSMEVCGNRAKQDAHRSRFRKEP